MEATAVADLSRGAHLQMHACCLEAGAAYADWTALGHHLVTLSRRTLLVGGAEDHAHHAQGAD